MKVNTADMERSDSGMNGIVKIHYQQKRVIKKRRIKQFQDDAVRQKYQEASSVVVVGFQERVHQ